MDLPYNTAWTFPITQSGPSLPLVRYTKAFWQLVGADTSKAKLMPITRTVREAFSVNKCIAEVFPGRVQQGRPLVSIQATQRTSTHRSVSYGNNDDDDDDDDNNNNNDNTIHVTSGQDKSGEHCVGDRAVTLRRISDRRRRTGAGVVTVTS